MNTRFNRAYRHPSPEASASPTGGDLVLGYLASTWGNRHGSVSRLQQRVSAPWMPLGVLWLSMLAYVVLMLRAVLVRYAMLGFTYGWDLAIFDQGTWLLSRFQTPFVTVRGLHIMADHFSAILYLLAPLYWVWSDARMLLIVQTLALAAGALPLFALARARLGSAWWGALFAVLYLLYPSVQWANIYEFHPDTFCVPLLLGAFLALERRRWTPYALCLLGVALTKENAGLTIFALGAWVWWSADRRVGWLTMGAGVLALAVAMLTIRYFNGGTASGYFLLYARYGSSVPEVALGILKHPDLVWADVTSDKNREYLGHLLRPLMYTPLLSPGLLLASAPAMLTNLLSSRDWMHQLHAGYYTSLSVPFLFTASVESCRRLRGFLGAKAMAVVALNMLAWTFVYASNGALGKESHEIQSRSTEQALQLRERAAAVHAAIASVPAEASVATQVPLTPLMSHRKELYTFPNPFVERGWGNTLKARRELEVDGSISAMPATLQADVDAARPEYVILVPRADTFTISRTNYEDVALAVFKSPSYGIVSVNRHLAILRRHAPRRAGWQQLARATATSIANEAQVEAAFWKWAAR